MPDTDTPAPDGDTVRRVAVAMCNAEVETGGRRGDDLTYWPRMARAAIAAMRTDFRPEPPEEDR